MTLTPDELLGRARSGDRQALGQLAEHWWPRMRRWALVELGDRTLAEDACQEALVRLVRFIGSYDASRPFDRWLRTLVRNTSRDVKARRTRRREVAEVTVARRPDLERRLDLDKHARAALAAFELLSPRQRELVERVDLNGESAAEVARDLGLAAGSVRNQLFSARRALRRHLAGRDVLYLLRDR